MKGNFKSELKTVLKVAKLEYFYKFFTSISIRALLLIIPVLFSEVINCVTKSDFDNAVILLLILIVIAGVYRFSEGINQVAYYNLYNKLFSYYNDLALNKTKDNSLFSLSRFTPAQYTNTVITDVDVISGFFTAGVIRVVQIIEFLVIYVYFFSIDIYIFVFAVVVSIIMLVISIKSGNKVQELSERRKLQLDSMTASVYDYFGSIKEIKSFNIYNNIYPSIEGKVKKYLDANGKYNVRFNCNNHAFLFVFELFRLLSVVYGVFLVKNGHMEIGVLLIIYNYYQKIIDNFSTILTINVEYRNLMVSLNRYNKVIEYSRMKKGGVFIDKTQIEGKIEFSKVLYGFRNAPILNKVSFTIPGNAITVLTGHDEASQNGIFDLLLKLNRQHEGEILLDGIDINDISDDSYFQSISSVRRHTVFFDIPFKENFLMINPDFTKVVDICKKIGLDAEIKKLDKGYDTVLTDSTPITQSTKELLVIARMLLKDSKILLFDDLINVLDDKASRKVLNLLDELKANHTIVIISNSKEIIAKADLVLDVSSKNVTEGE